MIWESSENQFGRRPKKKKVDKIFKFFFEIPPPLENVLDPRLLEITYNGSLSNQVSAKKTSASVIRSILKNAVSLS